MDLYYLSVFAMFSFALGCCVASFLNVCIWRIPREESVVRPGSHCPKCNAPIRWYQNIPILSWLVLRGRCASCREPISARYVVVELMGGVLFLMVYAQWAMPFFLCAPPPLALTPAADFWQVPVGWLVVAGLMLGSFIDIDHYYLPDRVTIGGMALGVPISFLVPAMHGIHGGSAGVAALCRSIGGMAFGFVFLWAIGWIFSKAMKRDAMGFGDVKLLGAIGAFFGPLAVLFTLVASSLAGSLAGGIMILRGKARLGSYTAVPYGPFLAIGALVWMFWGPAVIAWYMKLNAFGS